MSAQKYKRPSTTCAGWPRQDSTEERAFTRQPDCLTPLKDTGETTPYMADWLARLSTGPRQVTASCQGQRERTRAPCPDREPTIKQQTGRPELIGGQGSALDIYIPIVALCLSSQQVVHSHKRVLIAMDGNHTFNERLDECRGTIFGL